jgi:hypothetical protein
MLTFFFVVAPLLHHCCTIAAPLLHHCCTIAACCIGIKVGRRPANDRGCVDRESYSLSAGMALGMVTLGQGGNVSSGPSGHLYQGLSDLHLEDRLHQFMVGGSNMNATTVGSSEEHWIMNDNRYALDQNGVHHGKCGTFDVVSVLCTCIVLYCSVLCTCIVLYCSVLCTCFKCLYKYLNWE